MEINWDYTATNQDYVYLNLGLNNVVNTLYAQNNATTIWENHISNGGTVSMYDQYFNSRFFCGFAPAQSTSNSNRNSTFNRGKLSLQRPRGSTQYSGDWSVNQRVLINQFQNTNYLCDSNGIILDATSGDLAVGTQNIDGQARFNVLNNNLWTYDSTNSLSNGLWKISVILTDGSTTTRSRFFEAKLCVWRIKKT
jgi:hypothetical protein